MKRLWKISFLVVLLGCSILKNSSSEKELAFKKLVSKQRLIDIPLYFDLENYSDEVSMGYIVENSDTHYVPEDSSFVPADSSFIPTDVVPGRVWGIYKDTSECFVFITLGAWGYYVPEIITFDKQGNRIGKEKLFIGDCSIVNYGRSCSWIAKIYRDTQSSDLKFYTQDSVLDYNYDNVKRKMRGIKEHYIKFKSGSIDKFGRLTVIKDRVNLNK